MYKIFFENRFITLSGQPDQLQNYSLFYNYNSKNDLYEKISVFIVKHDINSMNIYSTDIKELWQNFRDYFEYREAAGGLVKDDHNRFLIIERRGKWDIAKGHREPGESSEECARREIEEETGVVPDKLLSELDITLHTYPLKGKYILKSTSWYVFSAAEISGLAPQEKEGITRVCWMNKDDLATIMNNTWASIQDVFSDFILKSP